MKANEVLKTLQISRSTLLRWRKDGILKAGKLPSGQYDWDEDSVYALINKGEKRGVYLYARVSTPKQKRDLENQLDTLQNFAMKQGYQVTGAFKDIASGISFEKRKEFFRLLDLVIAGKVSTVIITYKDRLSRVGYVCSNICLPNITSRLLLCPNSQTGRRTSRKSLKKLSACFMPFR